MGKNADRREPPTTAVLWGVMLKHYREQAGLTQERFAELINYSPGQVGSLEIGRRGPTPKVARLCDDALDTGGALLQLYESLVKHAGFHPTFQEWSQIEQEASMIRGYESTLVPGLLQTAEYAAAMLELDGQEAVDARMERQELLTGDDPPTIRYVLDEWVLRRPIGSSEAMRGQLEQLERVVVANANVHVQIVPSGAVPPAHGSFALATLESGLVAYEESTIQSVVVTDRVDVRRLEALYDRILGEALPKQASLELIRRVRDEEWTS